MEQKLKFGRTKAIDLESKTITALISTYNWDRMSERFAKGAWDFKDYLINPVVLWAHDQWTAPIAKCVSIAETDDGVVAVSAFDAESEEAMKIFDLYQRGFLSSFSVGFLPKAWELEPLSDGSQQKGVVYTQAQLLEYSCVPVPANPGAIVTAKEGETIIKVLGETFLQSLEIGDEKFYSIPTGPQRVHTKKTLEKTPAAAPADFESSAKYLIDLSKAMLAKSKAGEPIMNDHLALIKNAMEVFSELIPETPKEITEADLLALNDSVQRFGKAAAKIAGIPTEDQLMSRMNEKLENALKVLQSN
jgi:HK97 family phage prohead protease